MESTNYVFFPDGVFYLETTGCILSSNTPCGIVWDRIVAALAPCQVLPPRPASAPEYCGTTDSGAVLHSQWETR